MTKAERIALSDAIGTARLSMDRAGHLLQAMIDDYFSRYDPGDAAGAFAIRFYFPRMRAFASLLRDQLQAIESELPAVEWVDALKCEEETT